MKRMLVLAGMLFATATGFSQSFMHGAGLSLFVASAKDAESSANWAITYSPRFNFIEQDNLSVSVGIPISLGASGSYNSRGSYSDGNSLSFVANVPLIVNLNMGCGSTKENESRFGFFAGAGFGYHIGTANTTFTDSYGGSYTSASTVKTAGPVADAGVRIGIGSSGRNVEIRGMFMKGITSSKANVFGGGAVFNF
jgi:hypothetical protein